MTGDAVQPVADRIFELGENPLWDDQRGVYHWTDAGVASWYDFAVAAIEVIAIETAKTRERTKGRGVELCIIISNRPHSTDSTEINL